MHDKGELLQQKYHIPTQIRHLRTIPGASIGRDLFQRWNWCGFSSCVGPRSAQKLSGVFDLVTARWTMRVPKWPLFPTLHTDLKQPEMWPIFEIRHVSKHEFYSMSVFQRTKASQDISLFVQRLLVFCVHDSQVRCFSVFCRVGYAD